MKYLAALLVAYAQHAQAQTQEEKDTYPRFATEMDYYGYLWEAFEITTEDKYILTTFHITGTVEAGPITPTKESIMTQHGHLNDGTSWINAYHNAEVPSDYTKGKPMALQLFDLGYDLWIPSNRGTEYSQGHETLSAKNDPEYWAFSWSEMGLYDDVANIDFIKEKMNKDKIFYIGYSQGTVQMFYGLSHIEESYLEHSLLGFIALAPCSISAGIAKPDGTPDIARYQASIFKLHDIGVYAVDGPNWEEDKVKICENLDEFTCDFYKSYAYQTYSNQDDLHWGFNFIQQRFQEFAPNYLEGETQAALIPLDSIDKVPIAMIAGTEDPTCPYATAQHMKEVIGDAVKQFSTIEGEDHSYFGYASDEYFMSQVIHALENLPIQETEMEFLN